MKPDPMPLDCETDALLAGFRVPLVDEPPPLDWDLEDLFEPVAGRRRPSERTMADASPGASSR